MLFDKKEIILKNGQIVVLKSPDISDSVACIQHLQKTSEESPFLSCYPEEIVITRETKEMQANILKQLNASENEFMIAAYVDGELVGNVLVTSIEHYIKYLHRASLSISIQEKVCNLGLGTVMLEEALIYAEKAGFEQLELGVFADNLRARYLYEKFGFEQVGVLPRAFKLKDQTYRDEIQMIYQIKR